MNVHTLKYSWKQHHMKRKKKPTAARSTAVAPDNETAEQKLARLERENAQLKKTLAQLEMDREILQRAEAFFAKKCE
ncbi:MAG: hypothetical protein JNK05_36315 [Myxococcales bacterium]|nr:hypothetical protein [Myxococcales bacterium]